MFCIKKFLYTNRKKDVIENDEKTSKVSRPKRTSIGPVNSNDAFFYFCFVLCVIT